MPKISKLNFKTGNGIMQTGNGIIQTGNLIIFEALDKNVFYKMFLIFTKDFKIKFQNKKWNYPNRKWNYFSQVSDKNFFLDLF